LSEATSLAQQRFVTGASTRNWMSYSGEVKLPADLPEWWRHVLTDPQTSGGLLVACQPDQATEILGTIVGAGYPHARIIGYAEDGAASVTVHG
jgi:selenide,water dikinase